MYYITRIIYVTVSLIYIYTRILYNTYITCIQIYMPMFRLPHSRRGGSQGPETFLAPSADKQTGELGKTSKIKQIC